ncbi:MAG: hypothetical protein BGO28_03120 [Alphaproteobacteria bacterium 43-37]|nr:MAG: hypothetical protein BGO28_03120 [Alphaproteobacteria bacterium 43-37]
MRISSCLFAAVLCLVSQNALSYVVPDEALNLSKLPHCPPSRISYQDIPSSFEGDAIKERPKYYMSQLIGIKASDEPPYEAIKDPSLTSKLEDFTVKMLQLFDENDTCDKVGILYIARFQKYFCPNTEAFRDLSSKSKGIVATFFRYNKEVYQQAKEVSGCHFDM